MYQNGKVRSSAASGASTKASSIADGSQEENIEEMTDDELARHVNELRSDLYLLKTENRMFERFLTRTDPDLLPSATAPPSPQHPSTPQSPTQSQKQPQQVPSSATGRRLSPARKTSQRPPSVDSNSASLASRISRQSRRSRVAGSLNVDRSHRLNIQQRLEIVHRELEDVRYVMEAKRAIVKKQRAKFKAILEDAYYRLDETKHSEYDFQKKVLSAKPDQLTGRVPGEKLMRFLEECILKNNALVGHLRLRTSTVCTQLARVDQAVQQKEELGEALHPVDFEQLQIENSQYLLSIDEKNRNLMELKRTSARCNLVLNDHKKQLAEAEGEAARLENGAKQRLLRAEALERETNAIEEETESINQENGRLQRLVADFKVPGVITYVKQTKELNKLRRAVKFWEKRLQSLELAVRANQTSVKAT